MCPTEIIAFSDAAESFRARGCEVVGASTDSAEVHLAWIRTPRRRGGLGRLLRKGAHVGAVERRRGDKQRCHDTGELDRVVLLGDGDLRHLGIRRGRRSRLFQ